MKQIEINSLEELFKTVKSYNGENNYWFRGHSSVNYILNPSAYREMYVFEDQFYRPVEPRKVDDFNNHGDRVILFDTLYLNSFLTKMEEENIEYDKTLNIVEKYCLAQHYGVWTPMLDWTTDFSVALFFATDNRKKGQDCAVFLFEPRKWNDFVCREEKIFNSEEVIKKSNLYPLAMVGTRKDKRMCRQSGNFTVQGNMVWPLDHYDTKEDVLIKIIVPGNVADELKEYLEAFGINHDSIYVEDDEKDRVAKSLKDINETTRNKKLDELRKKWLATPDKDKGISHHVL